ncbi:MULTISPECIES: nitronate monooxygenase family protein [Aerococcus]|uniref:Probable nitronate monooxygenase n=1 Tax=Aerococcus sanguinicola TaxID=119206 RepID=A0A5N1GN33_9LACT|nr:MULTISPECIES: nitronate monooxygenase [Aerococcus]KAA9301726.1 enoyl-[acyl-carrier-protein] reductase FabK [Aerococcus sanguinicola]MDK6368860.1 nitronate monooxygenase [Aerococcus sp. UMB9870]MDK6680198.1 nitronate monooxygenase [Aerococcus sp. UMB8608]MDK6685697.1 nitronate monooxygenase [Aerococcus sp. UMB8623]MDK6939484.1 nitronate monooxygenase [Aerococcus sp. UMB8487]
MTLFEKIGLKYPIFQGAMARISTPELVAAVSQAGGLGILSSYGMSATELKAALQDIRQQTDQPFGVNLMLQQDNIQDLLPILYQEEIAVVTTGAGTPKAFAQDLRASGSLLIPVIASVKHAQKMEKLGVDALIVEGQEAGGHIGQSASLPLLQAVRQHCQLPLIAAGGFATGAGLLAAQALGACGVQMGTRFLASEECPIPDVYKAALLAADDQASIVTGRTWGQAVRSLKTPFLEEILAAEFKGQDPGKIQAALKQSYQKALTEESFAQASPMAGESAASIHDIRPVQEIIEQIMAEAEQVRQKLCQAKL